ncbi:hypothetical protein Bca101_013435 [Brassica carinata]
MTLHGTTSDAVAARLRQPEVQPLSCVANAGKMTSLGGSDKYLAKLSVYDKSEEAVFVLLGDAGTELSGKPAAELVRNYFEHSWADTPFQCQSFTTQSLGKSRSLLDYQDSAFTAPSIEEPLLTADGDGVILEGSEVTATMGAKELGDGTEFGNSKRVKRGD